MVAPQVRLEPSTRWFTLANRRKAHQVHVFSFLDSLCGHADVTGTADAWQPAAAFEVLTIPRIFPRMDHPATAGSRGAVVPSHE